MFGRTKLKNNHVFTPNSIFDMYFSVFDLLDLHVCLSFVEICPFIICAVFLNNPLRAYKIMSYTINKNSEKNTLGPNIRGGGVKGKYEHPDSRAPERWECVVLLVS